MITLQLHQTDVSQQRVEAIYITNIIKNEIYNKSQIDLFSGHVLDDKNFTCSEKMVDDENVKDVSYTIENKSKTMKVFIYDNMISFEGHDSSIIFNKLHEILLKISSYSKSNLWIFTTKFPIGDMKNILTEFNIKNDIGYNWSGILHINDMKLLLKKFEPFFKK